ncbi:macrophage mannose receptor 1-like [Sparus aurata]|uniref:macrophage mannose receptor 1-like n=1 Tax=Sparus aurata TaxID=8175 RepID=UPI0011C14394|nr:macrophage mannose receptor 1-like [Sparus aurata]
MQWSLVLLVLMGQCLFLVCPLHVYHFIKETKTWEEAQRYCREHYTDLATVYDMNDTQRLNDSVNTGEAWIGLHSNIRQENRVWHWSLPGVEVTKYFWAQQEPNDNDGTDNCVVIKNNEWHDHRCSHKRAFICYDEKPSGEQYIFHHYKRTWSEAQKHCRENHIDLVSGLHQLRDKNLKSQINDCRRRNDVYWIGLFRDGWRWSDGSNASFRDWESINNDNSKKCAVTLLQNKKWDSRDCGEKRSFFCYKEENMTLIKEPKTWEEAQRYCRENYTDLATVYDMNDTQRLSDSVNTDEAWIGLYNIPGKENRVWHWSLPEVEATVKEFWAGGQPDDIGGCHNCVAMHHNGWNDLECSDERAFICNDEKQYIFHDDKKTWSEAQEYCREKHTDLVSGLHQLVDRKLRSEIQNQKNKNSFYWIGLFTDGWGWSDGSKASFRNWKSFEDDNSKKCAVTLLPSQKWDSRDCDKKKPFFCYKEENMILIKEKKTWEEASDYCIKNHRGLVSITDSSQQRWAAEKAKEADTGYVWLGLRYTCVLDLWFWVNDELVCYKNWASDEEPVEWCDRAVAMSKGEGHEWHTKADNEKFNFICALH